METYIVTPGGEYYPRHHQYQEQTQLGDQEHHQDHQDPRRHESGDKQGEQTGQARQQVRHSQQMRTILRGSTFKFNVLLFYP